MVVFSVDTDISCFGFNFKHKYTVHFYDISFFILFVFFPLFIKYNLFSTSVVCVSGRFFSQLSNNHKIFLKIIKSISVIFFFFLVGCFLVICILNLSILLFKTMGSGQQGCPTVPEMSFWGFAFLLFKKIPLSSFLLDLVSSLCVVFWFFNCAYLQELLGTRYIGGLFKMLHVLSPLHSIGNLVRVQF